LLALLWLLDPAAPGLVFGAGDLARVWEDGDLLPALLCLLDPAALGLAFRAGCFPRALLDMGGREKPDVLEVGGRLPALLCFFNPVAPALGFRAGDLPRVWEDGDLLLVLLWLLVDLGRAAPGPAFHAGFGLLPGADGGREEPEGGVFLTGDKLFRELAWEPDLVDGLRLPGGKLAGEPDFGGDEALLSGELFFEPAEEPSEPLGSFDDAEPLPL